MATKTDHDRRAIQEMDVRESPKRDHLGKPPSPHKQKGALLANVNGKPHKLPDGNGGEKGGGAVSFSTNHNSVVCLPLVSEGLKLVWTQSDQTRELDTIPELVQAFNLFPYPTSQEVSTLARVCSLPLDKVKVWFMVQRIKYGISWASEDIEETRHKLAGPQRISVSEGEAHKIRKRRTGSEEFADEECEPKDALQCSQNLPPFKRPKNASPEPVKLPSFVPHFRSSLPPPQDAYYYRHPVDASATTAASPVSLELPPGSPQQRQGRYKKSKAQIAALRCSFLRENWPDEAELRRLQEETGLSRNDIRKWFSDSRYQLRNGRAGPGLTSPPSGHGVSNEFESQSSSQSEQLQPLSLVAQESPHRRQNGVEGKGVARGKGIRSNGSGDSQFFRIFLSNTLESFGERAEDADGEGEAAVGSKEKPKDEHEVKREEEKMEKESDYEESKPLELSQDSSEPELQPEPPAEPPSHLPSSRTPPFSSKKRSNTSSKSTQKSARSTKGSVTSSSLSSPSSSSSSSRALTAAGRPRKTKEQLDALKQYFLRCQWPKSEDYTELVELTGLPRADVIQWFGDTRYAAKNGQLRWVSGVREQILAEIAQHQNGGAGVSESKVTPKGGRKRNSQANGTAKTPAKTTGVSLDVKPLELYHSQTGSLQENDLDTLCRKSNMSYQQVREWFAAKEAEASSPADPQLNTAD